MPQPSQGNTTSCPVLTSPWNAFGLLRWYAIEDVWAIYDPEAQVSLEQLSKFVPLSTSTKPEHQSYLPYPNQSSFLLGNWFWNNGAQKSLTPWWISLAAWTFRPQTFGMSNGTRSIQNCPMRTQESGLMKMRVGNVARFQYQFATKHAVGNSAPQTWVLGILLSGTFTTGVWHQLFVKR